MRVRAAALGVAADWAPVAQMIRMGMTEGGPSIVQHQITEWDTPQQIEPPM